MKMRLFIMALATLLIGWVQDAYGYYNPSSGRWLNRDPIEEKGGKNLYGFAANDSINRCDILGKFPNPLVREAPPINNIAPPPSGPFSRCRIALQCGPTFSGQDHCGLVVDTGSGVYAIDGSGGTVNSRWVTPASTSDATGAWTDNPASVCECLFLNITSWNARNVPRSTLCANSNWNLKCLNKKCNVNINWGQQSKPIGYNCYVCRYSITAGTGLGNPYISEELRCPDQ